VLLLDLEKVSGVSLDEEMTSLMKYQHAYSGAARVITAMDEALDRLINGTGRVGL
jgi:flagellar hook-associated protein 1 FlgK